jgi:hypothetical protein
MKSRSIGGVATDGCAVALEPDVADPEGTVPVEVADDRDVDVEADVGASAEVAGV